MNGLFNFIMALFGRTEALLCQIYRWIKNRLGDRPNAEKKQGLSWFNVKEGMVVWTD